ncbi:MAG: 3'-5' exonuclease [Caldilineaceae bacterium]
MTPMFAPDGTVNGFVLTLQDMTERLAASNRRDFLLQRLTERMRGGLGSIRAAIEMLVDFPAIAGAQQQRFQQVIAEEAQTLGNELDQTMYDFADDLRAQWHFEVIAAGDLIWAIKHYLREQATNELSITVDDRIDSGIDNSIDNGVADSAGHGHDGEIWLRVDSYAVVHGLATAITQLRDNFAVDVVTIRSHLLPSDRSGQTTAAGHSLRFASLDVSWSNLEMSPDRWLAWKEQVSTVDDGDATLTLREVAERHGSEVWFQRDPTTNKSYFRLLLPLAEGQPSITRPPVEMAPHPAQRGPTGSRPEYYDFDLFAQSTSDQALHDHPLASLAYTVFDTETTGLDPQRDEIVAIGAVRVLNGRILRQEIFDQLIDPQRTIPRLATEIHGIDEDMVRDQPTIAVILPRFARFAEETILVGHNLAFDLRMFAMKADATGITFAQPILDTLLLSEVLMPAEQNHELEAIAARLGVNVLGRHTALGDAFVTAEIFLKLIPLLNSRGIVSLADALKASKTTYMARVQY